MLQLNWIFKKVNYVYGILFVWVLAPLVVYAQPAFWCQPAGADYDCSFKYFVDGVTTQLFRPVLPVLYGLIIGFFLWGVAQYILYADQSEKRAEGRRKMAYGLIALAVVFSFWAIAQALRASFF